MPFRSIISAAVLLLVSPFSASAQTLVIDPGKDTRDESDRPFTACAIALKNAGASAGFKTADSSERDYFKSDYVRVRLTNFFNVVMPITDAQTRYLEEQKKGNTDFPKPQDQSFDPSGVSAIKAGSAFDSPAHFAKFLFSPAYRNILRSVVEDRRLGVDSADSQLLGFAYGGGAHLLTSDKPMIQPTDLRGRTVIAPASSVVFVDHAAKVARGSVGELLGNRSRKGKSSALYANLAVIKNARTLPIEYRRYMSTSMTETDIIGFVAHGKVPPGLPAVIDQAIKDCSSTIFQEELKELDSLKREGTEIVSANRSAFRASTRSMIEKEIQRKAGIDRVRAEKTLLHFDEIGSLLR